ncbi:MAG TPA: putative quinol monooxygenase, partial [Mycobacterium sp.]|nr:putative quinol monooxygenase [Mycobacterium sp.]
GSERVHRHPAELGDRAHLRAVTQRLRMKGATVSGGPLFLVVTIKPRLDRMAEAEAQLQSMRRNTLEEPGCVFMHLVQPQDDPDSWVMLEMFRSRAAWDEHMRQPYNTEGNRILEDLLREPSELRLFDEK